MDQKFKKIAALLMSLVMLAGAFVTLSLGVHAEDEEDEVKKGEFAFAPHTYTEGDLVDIYYYTDTVFSGSALDYNEHLATMSMILAAASISSQEPDAGYDVKSQNLHYLFREWDFVGFNVNDYYMQKPEEQTMGVGIAYKIIGEGEDAYTVLAIVPRSAGYEKEWAGNFTVGKEGVHQGFATGRDIILEFAKEYVESNAEKFVGTVKVWTVGYSRGAGVANLLAAYLDDNSEALGVKVEKENIFAYTFGTPSTVEYANETEKAALETNYKNIHNRYSEYDIVTYAPLKEWNFTYYGTTKLFDVHNSEKKAEMLEFLKKTNETIYNIYSAEGSSADPDNFTPLSAKLNIGENGIGFEMVPADPSLGIPATQKAFLDSRVKFLSETLVPDRATYVDGGYEYALQCLTSLYFGLDSAQSSLLIGGMSHDVKMLAIAYYCYYIADYYLSTTDLGAAVISVLASALPILEESIAEIAQSEAFAEAEWAKYAVEFIGGEDYAMLKDTVTRMATDPALTPVGVSLIQGTLLSFASNMTGKVLGGGINALTIDETEKEKLFATMTSAEVTVPLTEFFVYLLLGNDDGVVSPFDTTNKSISTAVTFLANAGRYMRVHNNEIILSWLRTEDSYYAEEDWHIHETEIRFDANGHWEECACGYKSEVGVHSLGEWRTNPVNVDGKDMVSRRCPCGFEEFKEADKVGDNGIKKLDPIVIVIICISGAIVIGASVTAAVLVKKKKAQR